MKRILMALFSLYAAVQPCICQSKTCMAGLDITSLLQKCVTVQTHYCFARHWSLTGEASIPFGNLIKPTSQLEIEHQNGFNDATTDAASSRSHLKRLLFGYWPDEAFHGICLSLGVQTSNFKDIGCLARLGYVFNVWKSLHISTSLEVPVASGFKDSLRYRENLRIGISYKF